jgi:hypothetical protein
VESVENSKSKGEFPTLSTGLGNPARTKTPDFHISTAPAAGSQYKGGKAKMRPEQNSS